MEELIPITQSAGGKNIVDARRLHQVLVVEANGGQIGEDFSTWLKRMIEYLALENGLDYAATAYDYTGTEIRESELQIVKAHKIEYCLTLEAAKQIAMIQRNDKGAEVRRYFIWAEVKLKELASAPVLQIPNDLPSALRLAADLAEDKARLQHQIEEQAPKVEFADAVAVAANALSFADAARWLKIPGLEGRDKLIDRLRADKYIMQNRSPYQRYLDMGILIVEAQHFQAGDTGTRIGGTTRITPKGLDYFQKKYKPSKEEAQ